MRTPEVQVLVGCSCTGKSTYAEQYVKENPNTYIVSRDIERISLFRKYRMGSSKEEEYISQICKEKTLILLAKGSNVILDSTHLKWKYIQKHIDDFNYLADIKIIKFEDTNITELNARNTERAKKEPDKLIPLEVLANQMSHYHCINIPQELYKRQRWVFDVPLVNDLPDCYIFDLDGTLANGVHRDPYSPSGEEILNDKVILPVAEALEGILTSSFAKVIFMSGREDKLRSATVQWLDEQLGIKDPVLYMRGTGDQRPDTVVKRELYEASIKGKFNVIACFDDRSKVIEMWRDQGIFVFDVSQGKGRF